MKLELTSKSFGANNVLGAISLSVNHGEVVAVTGPSGIGKSTLVRIISGLDTRFDGTVEDVGRVGMVFQEPTLLPWRSLIDNITLATGCDRDAALNALDRVELHQRQDAFPAQLSLGQRRRVALARALAAAPQTLILDEAFASLDEATAARMRKLTSSVLEGRDFQTLLVTHNLEEAAELADTVLVLDGTPARIRLDHRIAAPRKNRDRAGELAHLRARLQDLSLPEPR